MSVAIQDSAVDRLLVDVTSSLVRVSRQYKIHPADTEWLDDHDAGVSFHIRHLPEFIAALQASVEKERKS